MIYSAFFHVKNDLAAGIIKNRVQMRDACTNPGTIRASGSHGISGLYVWVDWITFLVGRVTVMRFSVTPLLITEAPSTMDWTVAPESEMAYFTAPVTFDLSKSGSGHW